jgi:hypothetical protein
MVRTAVRKYETPVNMYRAIPQMAKLHPKIKARVPAQLSAKARSKRGNA